MARNPSETQRSARARKTLFIVAGVYVAIGFLVAAPAAIAGEPLSAFLGFLIISVALGSAVGLDALLRVRIQLAQMSEAIDHVREGLQSLERHNTTREAANARRSSAKGRITIDLAKFGKGDPNALTAATLDRSVFPRLVTAMEETPPASDRLHTREQAAAGEVHVAGHGPDGDVVNGDTDRGEETHLPTKNLLRTWKVALRDGDLPTCRSVFSILVDTVEPDRLAQLSELLQDLTARTERSLRKAFSDCVGRQDYGGALQVGEQICTLLPNYRIAADFRRIKRHLQSRLAWTQRPSAPDVAALS
ncbi:MAG: hypothetical protein ACE5HE_04860 [Phycisphaerae bacterium]